MDGKIYLITNLINNKKYVGQTVMTLKQRWNKHLSNSRTLNPTGIAGAIKKYGEQNFSMELLATCKIEDLNELEEYYIKKYNSFNDGYNLTLGGEGGKTLNLNEEEVIKKYQELQYISDTAKYFNCNVLAISNILHENNIPINKKPKNPFDGKTYKYPLRNKRVRIKELNLDFMSLKECGQWLIENNYTKTDKIESVQKQISRVLNGERQSYLKLHFELLD